MNKSFSISIIAALFIAAILPALLSCKSKSQSGAQKNMAETPETVKENSQANTEDKAGSFTIPQDMENILGEWTLVKILRDDNGNHKIDEDEEKTAIANTGYMKLNADGTCKFQTVMDGRYEIVTEEDGRKRIAIQDMAGTKYPMNLYIVSVSKNDLVINTVAGGSGFEIYKRP